jgi:hypothetical protein
MSAAKLPDFAVIEQALELNSLRKLLYVVAVRRLLM